MFAFDDELTLLQVLSLRAVSPAYQAIITDDDCIDQLPQIPFVTDVQRGFRWLRQLSGFNPLPVAYFSKARVYLFEGVGDDPFFIITLRRAA